jgi:hypothetical protein
MRLPLLSRRAALFLLAPILAAQAPAPNASTIVNGELRYRGFVMDVSAAAKAPNFAALRASLEKQIDIVADCGAKPEIIAFLRRQRMTLVPGIGDGRYSRAKGVEIGAQVHPAERPIVLHELLHALHDLYMVDGVRNADIERYYGNAVRGRLYPPDSYVLKNRNEFFAVTASLYLWGFVAKPPNNRETLRAKQPVYYDWLGQLFKVKK